MGEETAAVRETNDLCRDIASTRRRIEERADALRDRMSAKELVRPVTDRIKDTIGAGGEKILDAFRDNPVPMTLLGVGLGWLMLKDSGFLYRAGDPGRSVGSRLRSVREGAREAAEQVGEAAGSVTEKVGDVAGTVSEKVSGMAGAVSDRVGTMAHQTREAAHQAREAVRQGATRTADWFSRTLEENPLALAVGALAAGLVAGLAIPVSDKEREALGKIGEQVAQKVLEQAPKEEPHAPAEGTARPEAPAAEPKTMIGEAAAPAPPAGPADQGSTPSTEPHLG